MKYILFVAIGLGVFGCSQSTKNKPEMYEASELAELMREMVKWSKSAKIKLANSEKIEVPDEFFALPQKKGTRNEHLEETFQSHATVYVQQLKQIQQSDSQAYYYNKSIDACRSCHQSYCGGPLVVIDQLGLE